MKRLEVFLEESYLQESLDSPIEFYLTDDTKMPREAYAAFTVGDVEYGISLVETKYDKVYMLDLYRIVNVKKRSWSFLSPKHIRPALSTVIKFMEACHPFLQTKMNGVIIDIPGKTGSEKYVKFLSRVLKKSYIKKYREVPIVKTTDKSRNYLFMVKKGVEPTSLFKTATFWKNFKFDVTEKEIDYPTDDFAEFWDAVDVDGIPSDIMSTATEPYKTLKKTVSTKPSKRYVLGKVEVEVALGQDLLDQLESAVKNDEVKAEPTTFEKALASKGLSPKIYTSGLSYESDSIFYPLIKVMDKAAKIVAEKGFDESLFNYGNFEYAFRENFPSMSKNIRDQLINTGIATQNGTWAGSEDQAKQFLKMIDDATKIPSLNQMYKAHLMANYIYIASAKEAEEEVMTSANITTDNYAELKWSAQPVVEDDRLDGLNTLALDTDLGLSSLSDYEAKKIGLKAVEYLEESSPQVSDFVNKVNNGQLSGEAKKRQMQLWHYTGSTYESMNANLRNFMFKFQQGKTSFSPYDLNTDARLGVEFFLNDAPRLEKPLWVVRNMGIPSDLMNSLDVGEEFVDTAFLSTTLNPRMTFGYVNGRMKIYLPAGTPIYPAYNSNLSKQADRESEIVLAPASVIRITKRYKNHSGRKMFEGIYVGNATKSLFDKIQNSKSFLEELAMSEDKKYDPNGKFGGGMTKSQTDALLKLIKSGKLKLDTETKKK